ncbi:MAG: kinase/pyrophosphorylase [Proteocatella sp.]|nr:kinase/pyrophosphorylase [Proteocatella sp.]MBP8654695.1 kinase/pyrophosphorylase [Proteocatella sp.]MBP9658519.1 kinase/pyrophosphorylase [Proteocatella sp.]MBP9966497.1 kinase/pyrophosphorylase [Proteocatella sp.]
MMKLNIFVISDSLGDTAEQIAKACVAQFDTGNYEIKKRSYVLDEETLMPILEEAKNCNSILVYTLVELELIEMINKVAKEYGIPCMDIMGGTLNALSEKFAMQPSREAGVIRKLNKAYFKRVEAIEFAVKYDDGKDPRGLKQADVVILGISRTSKTPLSMYLANKNIKAANVPLVPESLPPREIYEVSPSRVIGLINSPEKLNQIREERLKALGLTSGANYASMSRILEELDYADKIMKKIGCPVIDVSNKAIEETADIIINILKKQGIRIYND